MAMEMGHVHIKTYDPKKTAQFYVDNFGATMKNEASNGNIQLNLHGLRLNVTTISSAQDRRATASLPSRGDPPPDRLVRTGSEGQTAARARRQRPKSPHVRERRRQTRTSPARDEKLIQGGRALRRVPFVEATFEVRPEEMVIIRYRRGLGCCDLAHSKCSSIRCSGLHKGQEINASTSALTVSIPCGKRG